MDEVINLTFVLIMLIGTGVGVVLSLKALGKHIEKELPPPKPECYGENWLLSSNGWAENECHTCPHEQGCYDVSLEQDERDWSATLKGDGR